MWYGGMGWVCGVRTRPYRLRLSVGGVWQDSRWAWIAWSRPEGDKTGWVCCKTWADRRAWAEPGEAAPQDQTIGFLLICTPWAAPTSCKLLSNYWLGSTMAGTNCASRAKGGVTAHKSRAQNVNCLLVPWSNISWYILPISHLDISNTNMSL